MEPNAISPTTESELAEDILEGAVAIAQFLFRCTSRRHIRKVYYLAERSKLPIFRLRSKLCARKSVLTKFISDQEKRSVPSPANSPQSRDSIDSGFPQAATEPVDVAGLLSTCSVCGARRDLPSD
jgi:hypothetical protein